jgi:hypothetical protein
MAKRFTDSEKWKDPFFEELTNELKLAWLYLLDDCDHAGIWKKSIKRLNFSIGSDLTEEELLLAFKQRIVVLNSDKWFIPKFVTFQYGNDFIKSKQKSVISAVNILNQNNLIKELSNGYLTLSIPLSNPINTLSIGLPNPIVTHMDLDTDQDKDMDKDMDMDMDKDMDMDMDINKDKRVYKSKAQEEAINNNLKYIESWDFS